MRTNLIIILAIGVFCLSGKCIANEVSISQPFFPEKYAGEFFLYLQENRKSWNLQENRKSWKHPEKFAISVKNIKEKIDEVQTKDRNTWTTRTKAEFVAKEWLYYYIAKSKIATEYECWTNRDENFYVNSIAALSDMGIVEDAIVDKFKIDRRKLFIIRASYMAKILNKLRIRKLEFMRAGLGLDIRVREEEQKITKLLRSRQGDEGKTSFGNHALVKEEIVNLLNKEVGFASDLRSMKSLIDTETEFIVALLNFFAKDSPSLVRQFAKQAGYLTDTQFAQLLWRVHLYAINNGAEEILLDSYLKKTGLKIARIRKLAEEEDKLEKRQLERWKTEFAEIRAKLGIPQPRNPAEPCVIQLPVFDEETLRQYQKQVVDEGKL